jgi:HK97 family phage major capsid protein
VGASLAAARSVYGQLAAQALTLDLSGPPPEVPGRLASPKVNASFIGEGQPIPVRSLALTSITLGPKKLGVLSTFTDELRKMSQPNVEEVLRSEITADTASAVDAVLLDADPATSIRPAGLLNGVAALPAAAAGVTAM